jgi:hypothetical protein
MRDAHEPKLLQLIVMREQQERSDLQKDEDHYRELVLVTDLSFGIFISLGTSNSMFS